MSYSQVQAYWYEWLVATKRGREVFEKDRRRLCRFLWESWAPHWRFSEEEFTATAASWDNPDWPAVTIHAYQHRWGDAPGDPALAKIEAALCKAPLVHVPTVVLHGTDDPDNFPQTSEGKEKLFPSGYERHTITNVAHFPQREAPHTVVDTILQLARSAAAA